MYLSVCGPVPRGADPATASPDARAMQDPVIVAIVDDDAGVRSALSMLVSTFGWEPRVYPSAEAYLANEVQAAGCLVVDLKMPGMSGVELQRELELRGIPVPVVVVTAHGDDPMADAALQAGALAVLRKPFREHELRYWIGRALHGTA